MNILMMTNTYKPFVGGVERSVETLAEELRKAGHRVIIVTPTFENMPREEYDVIRVPAIQRFNGTDFSVQLPIPGILNSALKDFKPDIVHSHHPYLIGDTALRVAAKNDVPIVFTFHTFFEQYTHYVPGDSPALKKFVAALSTGYANLCNHVIAPGTSVAQELKRRGVTVPISVIPSGIDVASIQKGNGVPFRKANAIPPDAFVLGTVSRMAPEKNINFLSRAVADFLVGNPKSHFVCVGDGPSLPDVRNFFSSNGLGSRVHCTGTLENRPLIDAYHAMDLFVFCSRTETQGLVIAEAMAAGVPVVALDATGSRDIIEPEYNGILVTGNDYKKFSAELSRYLSLDNRQKLLLKTHAFETVQEYAKEFRSRQVLEIYVSLRGKSFQHDKDNNYFGELKRLIRAEWDIVSNFVSAAGRILKS